MCMELSEKKSDCVHNVRNKTVCIGSFICLIHVRTYVVDTSFMCVVLSYETVLGEISSSPVVEHRSPD